MPSESEDELGRVREESLRRLGSGGLPVEAERRLEALRGRPGFFTSALSVSEFALGQNHGLRPISQVMGSCVYHTSVQPGFLSVGVGVRLGSILPAEILSRPFNEARSTALARLTLEAQECGADAVVGVSLRRGEHEFTAGSVEFVAFGTAVRDERGEHRAQPVLTGLSTQDYWKLRQAGHRALGLVSRTNAVICVPSSTTQWARGSGTLFGVGRANQELPEYSEAIRVAVAGAARELRRQAQELDADGIVGVKLDRSHQFVTVSQSPYGGGGPSHREDLIMIVHALGTAISHGSSAGRDPAPGGAGLRIQPVRHLDINPGRP